MIAVAPARLYVALEMFLAVAEEAGSEVFGGVASAVLSYIWVLIAIVNATWRPGEDQYPQRATQKRARGMR